MTDLTERRESLEAKGWNEFSKLHDRPDAICCHSKKGHQSICVWADTEQTALLAAIAAAEAIEEAGS